MRSLSYRAIDADQHYFEPDDCFSRHIDPEFRNRVIHTVPTGEPGIGLWAIGGQVLSTLPNNPADRTMAPGSKSGLFAGKAAQALDEEMYRPKDVPSHMTDRPARLAVLDEQGIGATVMLPTLGLAVEKDFGAEADALCANLRSFNRWIEEDWGLSGRIIGIPMVTLLDVDFAVAETERLVSLGARAVYIKTGPVAGRSPADPHFDRFWRTVEETGVKVIFHIDFTDFNTLYARHWSEDPDRTVFEYSALQSYFSILERPISDTIAALVLHNLFGRFPKVRVMTIELGSAWLRPLIRVLDKATKFSGKGNWLGGRPDDLPSEVLPRHLWVSPYPEEDIPDLVELIGVDHVLFGSDYPHAECLSVPLTYTESIDSLSDSDVRKIMRDNVASLLGLEERVSA
jgi:predicted TIM-barrel fold metal-dependent hydrolase